MNPSGFLPGTQTAATEATIRAKPVTCSHFNMLCTQTFKRKIRAKACFINRMPGFQVYDATTAFKGPAETFVLEMRKTHLIRNQRELYIRLLTRSCRLHFLVPVSDRPTFPQVETKLELIPP